MDISGSCEKKSVRARRMILEVENALQLESPDNIKANFKEWQLEFPTLFSILLRGNYDREMLAMMLAQVEMTESGKTNQHDASVAIGTILVDRFVKPQLGPSKE